MIDSNSDLNESFWKNKVIVITGGTSGLGKSLAIKLYQQGALVSIIARNKEDLDLMKNEYPNMLTIQADISDQETIYKISGIVQGNFGTVDVLFNNASSLGPTPLRLLMDTECEDLSDVLETNLVAPFRLIKAFLPTMIMKQKGMIINISSDAAQSAYETWGSYSVSKAGLDHLTRVWSQEVAKSGVIMLSLDPGDMFTPMHVAAIPEAVASDLYNTDDVSRDMLEFLKNYSTLETVRYSASEWRALI